MNRVHKLFIFSNFELAVLPLFAVTVLKYGERRAFSFPYNRDIIKRTVFFMVNKYVIYGGNARRNRKYYFKGVWNV